MIDFGFSISKSSHIQMDDVDLKLFNKLETLCPDVKTCIACGLCTATCTAGKFTDVSFRQIILMLQRGKEKEAVEKVKKCMMCGKLTSVNLPAVQVAVHNPQAIQVFMSGFNASNLLNNFMSTSSIMMCELFDMLKPKSIIILN